MPAAAIDALLRAYVVAIRADLLAGKARVPAAAVQLAEALRRPAETRRPARVGLSVAEAAARAGCSTRWMRHLAATGRIPARRYDGRTWLIEVDAPDFR